MRKINWILFLNFTAKYTFSVDNTPYSHNCAIVGYIFKHNRVGSDFYVAADSYIAEDFGSGTYYNVIFKSRMTFIAFFASSA